MIILYTKIHNKGLYVILLYFRFILPLIIFRAPKRLAICDIIALGPIQNINRYTYSYKVLLKL